MKNFKLLDCTLRDGGYYNDWDFSPDLVSSYLKAMCRTQVDIVEIGFRFSGKGKFYGPFAYSTDAYLEAIGLPPDLTYAVMLNASDYLVSDDNVDLLKRNFGPASGSLASVVRIAAHFREVEKCRPLVETLVDLGYRVGFNVMQVGGKTSEELATVARLAAPWPLDVLYFADSLGNMSPRTTSETARIFLEEWGGAVGFHAHNNMGRAMENVRAAVEAGVSLVDGTVTGMGRGAGNAQTEYLIFEREEDPADAGISALADTIQNYFAPLKAKHEWGDNLFYYLSAKNRVHPIYIQEMLSDGRYDAGHVVGIVNNLGHLGGHAYSTATRHQAERGLYTRAASQKPVASVSNWAEGREVLILGPGPEARARGADLQRFVARRKPVVLAANFNDWFPHGSVDAFIACNPWRLTADIEAIAGTGRTLICPSALLASNQGSGQVRNLDFGLTLSDGPIEISASGCEIPRALVLVYAIAFAEAAGASCVLLAGFDGYTSGDPRREEMSVLLKRYAERQSALDLISLTRTAYPLTQGSLYAPD